MTSTIQLFSLTPMLADFMDKCDKLGYTNNNSLTAMKFDWCRENDGSWWATVKDNKIVSVSGVHQFLDGYRALYRGAQIETRPFTGLNKYQMQNYAFVDHLPKQIEWADGKPVYITTSPHNDKDRSGKMSRVHRSAEVLAKQGVFVYIKDDTLFNVPQAVWQVNVEKYNEIRKS